MSQELAKRRDSRHGFSGPLGGESVESSGDLHQTFLREVNERIEHMNLGWGPSDRDRVLCECGHPGCLEKIEIAPADYERVRRFPTRFLVKPGHVTAGSERLVELADGYVVVEKLGASAATAIRRDPRRTPNREQEVLR
jgi:hypothetical protein